MLRTDLVPSRHLRNNRSRAIRRRDNPALLFLGPATPAANTSPDFNTPKRPPRIVKYIVDHICEPISPNRSTSDELSAPPQGAVKTPLSVFRLLTQSRLWILQAIIPKSVIRDLPAAAWPRLARPCTSHFEMSMPGTRPNMMS